VARVPKEEEESRGGARQVARPAAVRGSFLRFVLLFVVYLGLGSVLLALPWIESGFVDPWTRFNASGAASLTQMLGVEARAQGTQLMYRTGALNILTGCNAVEALLILVASLLAAPSTWTQRLLGGVGGAIAVLGANLIRLVNLVLVAKFYPEWLEVFHVYIWQALIVLVAFGYFLCWGTLVARLSPVGSPPSTA